MKRNERKVEMPEYTREGYIAKHEMHKSYDDNKIKEMPKCEHYFAPGMGHRSDMLDAENPPEGNKIKGMPPHQYVTFGVPVHAVGKMRNEEDEGLG